ncbi:MAG: RNA-binding protein [Oligoflexia bacterium]|nr:RNA-binding protein [Oligoflexia bacterium]
MSKKLFVGNLPFSFKTEDLQRAFQAVGEVVSANVVTDRETGRSRGFGFVEMASDQDAENAISQLNGSEQQGRKITVSEANSKPPRRDDRGGGGGGGGPRRPRY